MRVHVRRELEQRLAAWAGAVAIVLAPAVGRADAVADEKILVCAACHTGDASSEAPRIAGQSEAYLARQLRAFRQGERADPMMNAVARQLSDADVGGLAAYWARQSPNSDTRPPRGAEAITRSHMGFPKDFPSGFVLYVSSNNAEQKTVRKTYINAIGLAAARQRKQLPDGTVIIAVIHAARLGPDKRPLVGKDGALVADKITAYAGMEARAGWGRDIPAWLRNATWSYRLFAPDRTPRNSNQAMCLACHKPQAAVSYLFTFNELWDKARAR